jgi:UDP:flavonoid glycosyltransferase YjiC (YdhE family)
MNRRILLGWEIGNGRGHARILGWIAGALKRRGYEPILATQQLDALQSVERALGDIDYLQAPMWPGNIDSASYRREGATGTIGDICADRGLCSPFVLRSMLHVWDRLFALVQPAAVIGDYAPALLLAARGRLPSVAVGEGFTLPPAGLRTFPVLAKNVDKPKYDENELVEIVNACLREAERPTISHLPEIFGADRSCVAAFSELDPYSGLRSRDNAGPWAPQWDRSTPRDGRELFCYLSLRTSFDAMLVKALQQVAARGIPVRAHIPYANEQQRSFLNEIGVRVEPQPLPFEEIQRNARLAVSLGSFSFMSCALVAAIPQVVLPLGIVKHLTGRAIETLGVGRWIDPKPENPLEPTLVAEALMEDFHNERLARRAKELAPEFKRRFYPRPEEVVADLVDAIA